VADFQTGSDKIDLTGTAVDFSWIGNSAFHGVGGELRYAGGHLLGDVNGDKVADLDITVTGSLVQSDVIFL